MNVIAALPYWQFGPWTLIENVPGFNAPLEIHSFGMLVAIGVILAFAFGSRRAEQKMGISAESFQNFGFFLLAFGWVSAHVFDVVFYEPHLIAEDPLILFKVWGSISSYGGMLGGIIAVFIWKAIHKDMDLLKWADVAAWALPFAWFFGRMGCASVHDHPGGIAPSGWPLALHFPDGSIRHDLGFYEMLWWLVIVVVFVILDRKPRPKGFFLGLLFTLYAPIRFVLDFLRVWPASESGEIDVNGFVQFFLNILHVEPEVYTYGGDARYFGLTPAQYVSIGILIAGIGILLRVRKNSPMVWEEYDRPESDQAGDADKNSP